MADRIVLNTISYHGPVSYTHLDVYKRQAQGERPGPDRCRHHGQDRDDRGRCQRRGRGHHAQCHQGRHVEIKKIITFINGIVAERGKPKIDFQVVGLDMDVFHAIQNKYLDDFKAAMDTDDKNVRDAALLPIMDKIAEEYPLSLIHI